MKAVLLTLCGVLLAPIIWAQQPAAPPATPADSKDLSAPEYLLHNDWPNLRRYATANRQLPKPQPGTPRVVLLGNSITEGWPKADSAFFAGKPYAYVGRGIGGQTSGQAVLRFRQDVVGLHPAVVVLLIGINDVAENNGPYSPQETMGNIATMVELAQVHRIRVVLCSVTPAADFWWHKGLNPALKIVALNKQISSYAAQNGCVYLDYHTALADEQQGLQKIYGPDGVHPNLAGYRVMEPLLNRAVATALKKK